MDTLTNYSDFEQDIVETFKAVISNYRLTLFKVYEGYFELRSKHCILKFTFDRGDISCNIRPPNSDEVIGTGVVPIFKFLFPNDSTLFTGIIYDYKDQLRNYASILSKRLQNILLGDFSWKNDFAAYESKVSKNIGYMWNEIDRETAIYKKFVKGDVSWQEDLENYLKERNINL